VSFCVQALPSLQAVPFGVGGPEQTPVAALQTPPFSGTGGRAAQTTGFAPVHTPF
jgi:hypothetical protein